MIITLLLLSACDKKEKKQETFHTIDYYNKHIKARDARLEECKTIENQTDIGAQDCENARFSASIGKLPDTSGWY